MLALGRLKAGELNRTELAYQAVLQARKDAGEVAWFRFEGIKVRLADGCFYTPDFAVMLADGSMEMHEVKGYWIGDAKTKIKVAAEQYPFRFVAVRQLPKKEGGGWTHEDF